MPTPRRQPATATEPMPIWMAALLASAAGRKVSWEWLGGRAVFRNRSARPELIEPLGLRVGRGESVVVTWLPGQSEYTIQLYRRNSLAA